MAELGPTLHRVSSLTDLPCLSDIPTRCLYLRPIFDHPAPGPAEYPVAWDVVIRRPGGAETARASADALVTWAAKQGAAATAHVATVQARIAQRADHFAGLSLDRPRLIGIVNVTPDSFSDGGKFADAKAAVIGGRALVDGGADILDVGGESTRPGAVPVSRVQEMARILPVISGLASTGTVVSVDTRHARVITAALGAGATIVNDVTALTGDGDSLAAVATSDAAVVLMHMQGDPRTMQDDPRYDCAPLDVFDFLADRIAAAEAAGIARHRIAVDPGIGFGKTVAHNLEILSWLGLLHGLGCPVVLGASRKAFIGQLSRGEPANQRLSGSLAVALAGVRAGVAILRVHDVAATAQALALWRAIAMPAEIRS